MTGFLFDPSQSGLRKTMKEYQVLSLKYIWEVGDAGANSTQTVKHVNEKLEAGKSISQGSIINFLNRMVDDGVLSFRDATKKGGHYKIYYPLMDETGYKKYIIRTIIASMFRDFPVETREVLDKLHASVTKL